MKSTDYLAWVGAALLAAQRVEFLTHGIISHFKDISNDKKFKKLTPEVFLDESDSNEKLRRQTLGEIFRILKQEPALSLADELNTYLEKRNLLTHKLWRKYFKGNSNLSDNSHVVHFSKCFIEDSERLERFYKGMLYAMAENIASENEKKIPKNILIFKSENTYFLSCLQNK